MSAGQVGLSPDLLGISRNVLFRLARRGV